jgi:hypothetical protein
MSMPDGPATPRRMPWNRADGKPCYAVTEPGGRLEALADVATLETATIWHKLAAALVEGPDLSADEANFALAMVVEVLGDVLPVAVRAVVDGGTIASFGDAGSDIGSAIRDMKP